MFQLFAESVPLFVGTVFLLGLLIGSFLNVVIHRLPIMLDREWRAQARELLEETDHGSPAADHEVTVPAESRSSPAARRLQPVAPEKYNLIVPRSACPSCGAPITALQNVPVISYLALRGRCHSCRAPIPVRYPVVEVATGILSAAVAWQFGFALFTLGALLLTWFLITLTVIDLDHQLLPDNLTLPLLWLGLLFSLDAAQGPGSLPGPADSILGAAAGYSALWLVYHAFRLATGKEGMGYGDFKLLAALGAWLGWQQLPLVILLSAVTGAVVGIALIVVRGRDRNIPIPFGPYLAAAGWIALMWGEDIVGAYLGRL